jgi:phosphorylase/glycogen(starch) synthase
LFVHTLFEVSWEVCNKVGGIHTVVSTKARSMIERFGDEYIAIGPMLTGDEDRRQPFERIEGFEEFEDDCNDAEVPCIVGRWLIPGRPLTILVDFSRLYAQKDGVLAGLWERFRVDSIEGGWDYIEPVMFGHAAGRVIEIWWQAYVQPRSNRAVAHFHEWMTASGALYLKGAASAIGTVFTTHATMLGRAIASQGKDPLEAVRGITPGELAAMVGVRAKHSMEGVAAREVDVFTTVSEITADEAEAYHGRRPDPLLPNGMDPDVLEEIVDGFDRAAARSTLERLATCFLGEKIDGAAFLCISGRYEFHNKGIDLLLDALARLDRAHGRRPIVAFVLVPAGNSGVRNELQICMLADRFQSREPTGVSTHNLLDPDRDPVVTRCQKLELDNAKGHRVRIIQVPVYLDGHDGLIDMPYEAVLQGMDLTVFPSFYEPWGYTPQESLEVGVPTVTTDCAGFGRWLQQRFARDVETEHGDCVHVLPRAGRDYEEVRDDLAEWIEQFVSIERDPKATAAACKHIAAWTSWAELTPHYERAYGLALRKAQARGSVAPSPLSGWRALQVRTTQKAQLPQLQMFEVSAALPPALADLERLASNLWWTWNPRAERLFHDLAPDVWQECGHNPLLLIRQLPARELQERAVDPGYLGQLREVVDAFDAYLQDTDPGPELAEPSLLDRRHPVAYFCAEFGLHESFPIYSGGLGVLAGDHLKSASDLGLPFVAIGLFYRRGYLKQKLTIQGEQIAEAEDNLPTHLPIELVTDVDKKPVEVKLPLPSGTVTLRVWRAFVGRVPLYLLDTDHPANRSEDRAITAQLYAGDRENRLRQEIVLGRGGVRLLQQLGIQPSAIHINEGHAAFAPLERAARLVRDQGMTFAEARTYVRATTVFTSHTPIPAGHDRFPEDLVRRYFADVGQWSGLTWEKFYALGADGPLQEFNMTHLACRMSGFVNGVSKLHGEVTRDLLSPIWPQMLRSEIPVDAVTNGIHLATWTGRRVARVLGAEDRSTRPGDFARAPESIDLQALWQARTANKDELAGLIRDRLERAFLDRHDSPTLLQRMISGLDTDALWIGFARRFVPYKRAELLFQDMERLTRLLDDPERPVRFVFAGKAHPQDSVAQEILRRVVERTRQDDLLGRIVFVEGYDMELARALVQGVDVWLNTPLRPLEASGTSGMKVAANGGQNLSILDGWWAEADHVDTGWVIGDGREFARRDLLDEMEGHHLMQLLEEEVVPEFFDRDAEGLPRVWLERCRRTLTKLPTVFNTDRMVDEYFDKAYLPATRAFHELRAMHYESVREVAKKHARIRQGFQQIRIVGASVQDLDELHVLSEIRARVDLDLGPLGVDDVVVEAVLGPADAQGKLREVHHVVLTPGDSEAAGIRPYFGSFRFERSGTYAYGIRVRARRLAPWDSELEDLVLWATAEPA